MAQKKEPKACDRCGVLTDSRHTELFCVGVLQVKLEGLQEEKKSWQTLVERLVDDYKDLVKIIVGKVEK